MRHESKRGNFIWFSWITVAALVSVLLSMGGRAADQANADAPEAPANNGPPQIIDSTPKRGATDVDPVLSEISVTFDRDMDEGMSWTGGPPFFPPVDETQKARWTNARTCVLPVKLAGATYYRVGLNASGYQNFRSKQGVTAPSSVLCFVTQGADDKVKQQVQAPTIVKIEPANGAQDVDPATTTLSVTFSMPMGAGMSWTRNGPNFPASPPGKKATWSDDALTCAMPVTLEAGREYQIGLNHPRYNNFQSKWGVPLEPVVYKFRTAAGKPASTEKAGLPATKAYPIEVKASEIREYSTRKIEFGDLRLELGAVTVAPISCELGVTGVVLIGSGTYRYTPEPEKVFEGTFRGGMLRFNPKDQAAVISLEAGEATTDQGFAELARHVLNALFRHCWHSGMQALIPPEGALAAVLYTKEHGDLLISWSDGAGTAFSFTTRETLYEKK